MAMTAVAIITLLIIRIFFTPIETGVNILLSGCRWKLLKHPGQRFVDLLVGRLEF